MPGKPADQSQSGDGDHVCEHKNKPSVWFAAPGAQASTNRIVLVISILSQPASNRSLWRKPVSFLHEAAWSRIDRDPMFPAADFGVPLSVEGLDYRPAGR